MLACVLYNLTERLLFVASPKTFLFRRVIVSVALAASIDEHLALFTARIVVEVPENRSTIAGIRRISACWVTCTQHNATQHSFGYFICLI